MVSPAVPGFVVCLTACVLLIFATVSSPIWEAISFLDVNVNGEITHFGVFGYTGSPRMLGYTISPSRLGLGNYQIDSTVIYNLTYLLVLHPIAAGLAGLAVLFGLCGSAYSRLATILMAITSAFATMLTLLVFVIDMVLFGIARNRINDTGLATAQYGNANWMVLGALVAHILGFCAASLGSCGRFSRKPITEKV